MTRDLSRRRLLASAGVALSAGATSVVGASDDVSAVSSSQSSGPPALRWNRTYAARTYSGAGQLVETDDGDYVALGSVSEDQFATAAGWLFGVDGTTGEGQWGQVFEQDGDQQVVYQAFAPAEEGYVLLGRVGNPSGLELRNVTTDGEVRWRQQYSPAVDAEGAAMLQATVSAVDDGFVVATGRNRPTDDGGTRGRAVAFKIDTEGVEQWRHTFFDDPELSSQLLSLSAAGDGEFVATGLVVEEPESDDGTSVAESALLRFDGSGDVAWSRRYTAGDPDSPNRISQLVDHVETDDGYLAVGFTGGLASAAGWVVPTDDSGVAQNSQTLGGDISLQLTSVTDDDDGTYYATGAAQESGSSVAYLGAFDPTGTERWAETTGRKDINQFSDVLSASDGGIVVAGTTRASDGSGDTPSEAWLAKLGGEEAPSVTVSQGSTATSTASTTEAATATPTESPTETATATPTPTEAVTGEPTATTAATAAEGNTQAATSSGDGPGFGVGSAVAGLVGGALLRRVRDEE